MVTNVYSHLTTYKLARSYASHGNNCLYFGLSGGYHFCKLALVMFGLSYSKCEKA